jgi:hypothetical protein
VRSKGSPPLRKISPPGPTTKSTPKLPIKSRKLFLNLSSTPTCPSKRYLFLSFQASEALRINYSSAKAILSTHKKTIRVSKTDTSDQEENSVRSSYRTIGLTNQGVRGKFSVACSVGGKEMGTISLRKTKIIFKPEILVPVRCMLE